MISLRSSLLLDSNVDGSSNFIFVEQYTRVIRKTPSWKRIGCSIGSLTEPFYLYRRDG